MIKILLVEDDVNLNDLVKTILERNGFLVSNFYSANDALRSMENKAYDLIISDFMMPNIEGFEFA